MTINRTEPVAKRRRPIGTSDIIVGYAMSRLDQQFLREFGFRSWHTAFKEVSQRLHILPASVKNLRDEFDPVHGNSRRGWHKRSMRKDRQRVLGEFCDASDAAVLEVARRILAHDHGAIDSLVRSLTTDRQTVDNVAERLRTGRLAEDHFRAHSDSICGVPPDRLVDVRNEACGFDFAVSGRPRLALEVKGMKELRGPVMFTDHEWRQASMRGPSYWLVVIGGIESRPRARVIRGPVGTVAARLTIRRSVVQAWIALVDVA